MTGDDPRAPGFFVSRGRPVGTVKRLTHTRGVSARLHDGGAREVGAGAMIPVLPKPMVEFQPRIEATKVGPSKAVCGVSRPMRWLGSIVLMVSLSACLQIGKAGDSGSTADEASAGSSGAGASGGASATGTNCGVDPSTGVALCLGISSCPGVRVDPDQFPDCGYRIAGSKLDLECLCGDALCPMGSAASCLDAKALLAEQSAQSVCAGVAEGRCQVVHESSHTSSSTCDKDCRAQCSGVPGCVTLCGC